MKETSGTHRWWIMGITLVVVIAVLGLGYGLWALTSGTGPGQEQVLQQEPTTGITETGPEQVMTEPQISPEGEEAIVVPGVEVGTEAEAAISVPAYTLDMAQLAAETRILPVQVMLADVGTIVSLLGPAALVEFTPELEEAIMFLEEEVTPRFPFEEDFFYFPPVIGAAPEEAIMVPEEVAPVFPLEEEFMPLEEETTGAPAEESLLPKDEQLYEEEVY